MAENGYGLAGPGMGKVKSISQYRLTPGFGATPLQCHMYHPLAPPCRFAA